MTTTEQAFMQWMRDKKKPDGSAHYKESTIRQYASALRSKLARYREDDESIKNNLFDYTDVNEFSAVRQSLLKSQKFLDDIANPGKGNFNDHTKGMERYEEFLNDYTMNNASLKAEDDYQFRLHSPGRDAASLLKGKVQIDSKALAKMQQVVRQNYPDFKNFTTPGESYLGRERNYKAELQAIFHQELLPLILSEDAGDIAAIHSAFKKVLSRRLKTFGNSPQNLVSWRTLDYIPKLDEESSLEAGYIYKDLLNEDHPLRDRLDAFAERYSALLASQLSDAKISWQSHLRSIASFLLGFAYPQQYIFVRANVFKEGSKQLLGWDICADYSSKKITLGEEYERILNFASMLKAALQNWVPKDYIDIQSFLWIGTQMQNPPPEPERDLPSIFKAIAGTGLRLNESILRRYHISLKTRGFVILAGVSGTGKTWLAQAYAGVVNAKSLVVPVAPNWNSNEDLLGHYNPFSESFCPTSFTSFLEEAADDESDTEYHLILDEMNLARVEHYFAKFLSVMELRQRGEAATLDLGGGKIIPLPQTLKFIGTVNIDETTHGFADKVYDRAQLIELPLDRILLAEHIAGKNFAPVLIEIWEAVHRSAPFAFRVLDEISAYVTEAASYDVRWPTALDEMTVQKILPRLKGHDAGIGSSLTKLKKIADDNNMPLTTKKAEYMLEQFNEYGFSSFFQK